MTQSLKVYYKRKPDANLVLRFYPGFAGGHAWCWPAGPRGERAHTGDTSATWCPWLFPGSTRNRGPWLDWVPAWGTCPHRSHKCFLVPLALSLARLGAMPLAQLAPFCSGPPMRLPCFPWLNWGPCLVLTRRSAWGTCPHRRHKCHLVPLAIPGFTGGHAPGSTGATWGTCPL
jgi:hypothetical protein